MIREEVKKRVKIILSNYFCKTKSCPFAQNAIIQGGENKLRVYDDDNDDFTVKTVSLQLRLHIEVSVQFYTSDIGEKTTLFK